MGGKQSIESVKQMLLFSSRWLSTNVGPCPRSRLFLSSYLYRLPPEHKGQPSAHIIFLWKEKTLYGLLPVCHFGFILYWTASPLIHWGPGVTFIDFLLTCSSPSCLKYHCLMYVLSFAIKKNNKKNIPIRNQRIQSKAKAPTKLLQ